MTANPFTHKNEDHMHPIPTIPPKTKRPVAVAIQSANWPAWTPRPVSPEPAPEDSRPATTEIECELPSVAEARSQVPKAPAARRVRAADSDDQPASLQERGALCRLIGNRLREARELSGLSQQDAAQLLGYSNSSKLAKVELASDTNSVPFWLIAKAAQVYEVSADYLLGISEDWDIAPDERCQRQVGRWLLEHWQTARERDLVALADVSKKMSFVAGAINTLTERAENVQHAFDRLRDLNAGFPEMIAGAKLAASVERLVDAGCQARRQLRRLHVELAGAAEMETSHG